MAETRCRWGACLTCYGLTNPRNNAQDPRARTNTSAEPGTKIYRQRKDTEEQGTARCVTEGRQGSHSRDPEAVGDEVDNLGNLGQLVAAGDARGDLRA